jgi:hypothetical protein
MRSELRERLGPRVQVRVVDKFSGSPGVFSLRLSKNRLNEPVSLGQLLIRCGVAGPKALEIVDSLRVMGSAVIEFPSAPPDIGARLAAIDVEARPIESATLAATA